LIPYRELERPTKRSVAIAHQTSMSRSPLPNCPKCGRNTSISGCGRRYALYPAGYVMILGWLAIPHRASCPDEFECRDCSIRFGVRSAFAKVNLVATILLVFLILIMAK